MNLSVVIPTHKPDKRLVRLLQEIRTVFMKSGWAKGSYEIILVDDGNAPSELALLCTVAGSSPGIRMISMGRRSGQQRATVTGICSANGDVIVTMDDDGAHPPACLPHMLSRLQSGKLDLVYASPDKSRGNFVRRSGTGLNQLVFQILLGVTHHARVTSFRAFRRDLAREICAHGLVAGGRTLLPPNVSAILLARTSHIGSVTYATPPSRDQDAAYPSTAGRRSQSRHSAWSLVSSMLMLALVWAPRGLFIRLLRGQPNPGEARKEER